MLGPRQHSGTSQGLFLFSACSVATPVLKSRGTAFSKFQVGRATRFQFQMDPRHVDDDDTPPVAEVAGAVWPVCAHDSRRLPQARLNNKMSDQLAALLGEPSRHDEVFLLYEGDEFKEEFRNKLTHVRVAPHVTKIPNAAFQSCGKLVEIEFNEGLRSIGSDAFRSCTALQNVTLPPSVIELREGAFAGCSSLIELKLNEGVQVIGGSAFRNCKALRDVTLPSSVIELRGRAFDYCSSLVDLQLNEGLQVIGSDTHFGSCLSLRSVTIPSSVTTLGKGAFLCCMNLSEVIFLCGKRLLNQEFFSRGIFSEDQGLLNQEAIKEMLFDNDNRFAFHGCPFTIVKISISWALSERMARLPKECM
ncbi:hypothetical protein THAOC_09114, partial [Thalassiosira oceanica]